MECRGCGVGCRSCELIDRVERTADSGSTFEELKSLRVGAGGLYQHCLKIVDEDRLFVAGGWVGWRLPGAGMVRRTAIMYRFSTDSWTRLNPMTHEREGHTCSLVENHSAQKQIVVTGGWDGFYVLDSVEIWDLDTGLWHAGG